MELKDFKHKIHISVRFSDLDAMGHVNNAAYLSYLEEARIAYFNKVLNIPNNNLAFGAVIARIEIDYIKQIRLGDQVEVYTHCARIGNKSSDIENLIVVVEDGNRKTAAKAVTKLVSFDYSKKISVPVSDDVKNAIQSFEQSIVKI